MRIAIAAAIHGYFLHRASRNEGVSKTAMPMPTMRPTHTLRSAHCTVYNSPVRRTGRSQMAEIVLFHSALGLRPGVRAASDRLRSAGHTVHTPDLFDGRVFDRMDEGLRTATRSASRN